MKKISASISEDLDVSSKAAIATYTGLPARFNGITPYKILQENEKTPVGSPLQINGESWKESKVTESYDGKKIMYSFKHEGGWAFCSLIKGNASLQYNVSKFYNQEVKRVWKENPV